ncbi:hypothetical protein G6F55_014428 [Rhizopus delemar]|nr:hypothetical protein G6F55_014428 [Rhizopus delemar]
MARRCWKTSRSRRPMPLRGTIEVAADAAREQVEALALAEPNAAKILEGLTVRKIIIVPGKIVNIVAA